MAISLALPRGAVESATMMLLAISLFAAPVGAAAPPLPHPLAAGWQGKAVCEKLHDDASHRILRCTFPPGVGHERHYHPQHFGYALSGGRVRMTDSRGTRELDLQAGSHFTSQGTAWHEIFNIGDTTIAYLIVEPK